MVPALWWVFFYMLGCYGVLWGYGVINFETKKAQLAIKSGVLKR